MGGDEDVSEDFNALLPSLVARWAQNLTRKEFDSLYAAVGREYARRADLWQKTRWAVGNRDKWTCRYCGSREGMMHIDHMIPGSRGGTDEMDNLITACRSCNTSKSDLTPNEWLVSGRPQARIAYRFLSCLPPIESPNRAKRETVTALQFPTGARVRHPVFGVGTVRQVAPSRGDVEVTVDFDERGQKRLMASLARLEPLDRIPMQAQMPLIPK